MSSAVHTLNIILKNQEESKQLPIMWPIMPMLYLMGALYFSNSFYICGTKAFELATEMGNIQIGRRYKTVFVNKIE